MKKRAGSMVRIATPFRAWMQRFVLLFFTVASLGLLLVGKADTELAEHVRTAVGDGVAPLLDAATRPVETVRALGDEITALGQIRDENARLRTENAGLLEWQQQALALRAENVALRDLLNVVHDPELSFLTARVVGDQGGAYVRTVLIAAGTRDGVARGQPAMTGDGLAGRVVEVGFRSARVLLLTDINSRVPVFVGEARHRAILVGNNTTQPVILYLDPDVVVPVGARVVTSGDGGVFPPDLAIGQVVAHEDSVRLRPFVDYAHMEYLRIIDYELPGLLLTRGELEAQRAETWGIGPAAASSIEPWPWPLDETERGQ